MQCASSCHILMWEHTHSYCDYGTHSKMSSHHSATLGSAFLFPFTVNYLAEGAAGSHRGRQPSWFALQLCRWDRDSEHLFTFTLRWAGLNYMKTWGGENHTWLYKHVLFQWQIKNCLSIWMSLSLYLEWPLSQCSRASFISLHFYFPNPDSFFL